VEAVLIRTVGWDSVSGRHFDEDPSLELRECVVAAVLDDMSVEGTMGAFGDSVVIPVRLVRWCRGRSRSVSLPLTCRGVERRRVAGSKWLSREERKFLPGGRL